MMSAELVRGVINLIKRWDVIVLRRAGLPSRGTGLSRPPTRIDVGWPYCRRAKPTNNMDQRNVRSVGNAIAWIGYGVVFAGLLLLFSFLL